MPGGSEDGGFDEFCEFRPRRQQIGDLSLKGGNLCLQLGDPSAQGGVLRPQLGDSSVAWIQRRRAFRVLLELLERGQEGGVLRSRRLQSQAAACWAEVHGITMLVIDGLFVPEKVGQNAIEEPLTTLFEGLAI